MLKCVRSRRISHAVLFSISELINTDYEIELRKKSCFRQKIMVRICVILKSNVMNNLEKKYYFDVNSFEKFDIILFYSTKLCFVRKGHEKF